MQAEGTSSLVARVAEITAWVHQLEKEALRIGITQTFTVARSHYVDNINFEATCLGFAPGYDNSELDAVEATVTPIAKTLVSKIKDMVLPRRG